MKVYKDLKVTGRPVMDGQKIETVNVMSAKKVYKDKSVLPDTQELQEKLQIKLQLGPSEDVANQIESKKLKFLIYEKLRESEIQSKSRSLWKTNIHETTKKMQINQSKDELVEGSQAQLRKSSGDRRPTIRYIDEAYDEVIEPTIFQKDSNSSV
ncbi:hypothetical protein LIER_18632 [Lithospermum erythrorhizon]|uniref:Uncharacterized protein n=1 Tax=Lithospermum erythrorhizon TaxID=34254 RepID=A0AAV3QHC4_LITER